MHCIKLYYTLATRIHVWRMNVAIYRHVTFIDTRVSGVHVCTHAVRRQLTQIGTLCILILPPSNHKIFRDNNKLSVAKEWQNSLKVN